MVTRSVDVALEAVPRPTAVLDVGCGTGALLGALSARLPATVELAGVDPAEAMLRVARTALAQRPNIRLAQASAERLPFPDAQFDLVISTVSFHHWRDQQAGLSEVGRVLRADGRLVLVDHFATGWLRVFDAVARRGMRTRRDLELLMEGAQLVEIGRRRVFDLGPFPLIQAVIARS